MEYIAPYFGYITDIIGPINPLTLTFIKALALSLFLGYIMGAEREFRGKDAGISTNMFVITGSMIFTFLSMTVDPTSESRIAAQIVSGIGFLGAGLILKEGTGVKNLTTAASIWYAGAVGMLVGFGFYGIAFVSGVAGVLIPRVRHIQNQVHDVEEIIATPKKKAASKKK